MHHALILATNIDLHALTAAQWFGPWLIGLFMGLYARKFF